MVLEFEVDMLEFVVVRCAEEEWCPRGETTVALILRECMIWGDWKDRVAPLPSALPVEELLESSADADELVAEVEGGAR